MGCGASCKLTSLHGNGEVLLGKEVKQADDAEGAYKTNDGHFVNVFIAKAAQGLDLQGGEQVFEGVAKAGQILIPFNKTDVHVDTDFQGQMQELRIDSEDQRHAGRRAGGSMKLGVSTESCNVVATVEANRSLSNGSGSLSFEFAVPMLRLSLLKEAAVQVTPYVTSVVLGGFVAGTLKAAGGSTTGVSAGVGGKVSRSDLSAEVEVGVHGNENYGPTKFDVSIKNNTGIDVPPMKGKTMSEVVTVLQTSFLPQLQAEPSAWKPLRVTVYPDEAQVADERKKNDDKKIRQEEAFQNVWAALEKLKRFVKVDFISTIIHRSDGRFAVVHEAFEAFERVRGDMLPQTSEATSSLFTTFEADMNEFLKFYQDQQITYLECKQSYDRDEGLKMVNEQLGALQRKFHDGMKAVAKAQSSENE